MTLQFNLVSRTLIKDGYRSKLLTGTDIRFHLTLLKKKTTKTSLILVDAIHPNLTLIVEIKKILLTTDTFLYLQQIHNLTQLNRLPTKMDIIIIL